MKIHTNITQGSQEWLEYRKSHFNASDAPAMLGLSPYKTRTQLLNEMKSGISPEIDSATQRRFDDGHRFEALARPLAEEIIGEDLFPMIASEGKLSASFDGLTMDETICFEHKTLNDDIRSATCAAELGAHLRAQMEQQLMIANATKCLFMASKWDGDRLLEEVHHWYESDQEIRDAVIQGWCQFAEDLENHVIAEEVQPAVAQAKIGLPALSIQVNGSINLISNLDKFGARLNQFVDEIDKSPNDDQGFADAEAAIKTLEKAETALEAAEANALAQTSSVDEMRKTVAMYKETARNTRLMLQKMVKSRKDAIRIEIAQSGTAAFAEHIASLNKRLGKPYMPHIAIDCAGAMKGLKTLSSLRNAVDTELARSKIEANVIADKIEINLNSLRELAKDHAFLFADTEKLVMKANDDLVILIKSRIADHTAAEAAKLEAERKRIQAEEEAKAKAAQEKINADAEAQRVAAAKLETDRLAAIEAEKVATQTPAQPIQVTGFPFPTKEESSSVVALPVRTPLSESTPPSLRLGQIGERLGFGLTADFLKTIGFEPAGRDKSAILFHESQFPHICAALVRHINQVQIQQAA
jgi:putative phage-type endonuclease